MIAWHRGFRGKTCNSGECLQSSSLIKSTQGFSRRLTVADVKTRAKIFLWKDSTYLEEYSVGLWESGGSWKVCAAFSRRGMRCKKRWKRDGSWGCGVVPWIRLRGSEKRRALTGARWALGSSQRAVRGTHANTYVCRQRRGQTGSYALRRKPGDAREKQINAFKILLWNSWDLSWWGACET